MRYAIRNYPDACIGGIQNSPQPFQIGDVFTGLIVICSQVH